MLEFHARRQLYDVHHETASPIALAALACVSPPCLPSRTPSADNCPIGAAGVQGPNTPSLCSPSS